MKHFTFSCALFIITHCTVAQSSAFIATDKATEDIAQMVSTFENVHYNPYFKTRKEEFDKRKAGLMGNWAADSISFKQFMATAMTLSAEMSGGHSYMYWQNPAILPEAKEHLYIPFTGKLIENHQTFRVTKSDLPGLNTGMHIKSINGISAVELFEECMAYIGGIEAFKMANTERIFPLYLFFNSALHPPYEIELQGSDTTFTTEGIDIGELATFINAGEKPVDYSFEIRDGEIGLIAYNKCNNYGKFEKFLKKTFETIARKNIDKLIIDIRENGGGDSQLNELLLAYITTTPYRQSSGKYWKVSEESKKAYAANAAYTEALGEEFMNEYMNTPNQEIIEVVDATSLVYPEKPKHFFEGKSCILIGSRTFSSANFLADAVKTFNITTLIGTSTGENTNDFGEQLSFTLKNSGSEVYISSTYDIGANGNASIFEPVYPDIEVENDALEFALNWIKKDAENE